jgi:hypothetical protein
MVVGDDAVALATGGDALCEPQAVTPIAETASAAATRLQCLRAGFPCDKAIGRFIQGPYEMPGCIAITPAGDQTSPTRPLGRDDRSRHYGATGPICAEKVLLSAPFSTQTDRPAVKRRVTSPAASASQNRLGLC